MRLSTFCGLRRDQEHYICTYINYFLYEVKDFQLVKILPQHKNGIWLKIKLNVTFVRGAKIEIYLKVIKAS
jgi:hypothetical protein